MQLFSVLSFALLCRASAYARVAKVVHGQAFGGATFQDEIDAQKESHGNLGELQFVGGCCGDAKGEALDVQTEINLNEMYGKNADVLRKELEAATDCQVVQKKDFGTKPSQDCHYVMVYNDLDAPLNELAANCVSASICKDDVVGLTKGKIATYGVVLQILQRNLGHLVWLGEGNPEMCAKRMNEINRGDLSKVFKMVKHEFLGMHWEEKKMDIHDIKKLDMMGSLGDCKDNEDGTKNSYLYIHKNLLWDNDKQAVDIGSYTKFKEQKLTKDAEKELLKEAEEKLEPVAEEKVKKDRRLANVVV